MTRSGASSPPRFRRPVRLPRLPMLRFCGLAAPQVRAARRRPPARRAHPGAPRTETQKLATPQRSDACAPDPMMTRAGVRRDPPETRDLASPGVRSRASVLDGVHALRVAPRVPRGGCSGTAAASRSARRRAAAVVRLVRGERAGTPRSKPPALRNASVVRKRPRLASVSSRPRPSVVTHRRRRRRRLALGGFPVPVPALSPSRRFVPAVLPGELGVERGDVRASPRVVRTPSGDAGDAGADRRRRDFPIGRCRAWPRWHRRTPARVRAAAAAAATTRARRRRHLARARGRARAPARVVRFRIAAPGQLGAARRRRRAPLQRPP